MLRPRKDVLELAARGQYERFKAIDALRRRARLNSSIMESMGQLEASLDPIETDKQEIEDGRLRLIFT